MAIDISSMTSLNSISTLGSALPKDSTSGKIGTGSQSFEALLNSAIGMIKETEDYTNKAEEAELAYMLGLNDSISDLMVAQTKANVSLQYTVAVRNAVLEAYNQIMNLQF